MGMLAKLNNQPSDFNTKLRLEPLNDPKHFFILECGNCHILWGEIFLVFDEALNILGKLND